MEKFYERYWQGKKGEDFSDFPVKWPKLKPLIPRTPKQVVVDYGCGDGKAIEEMQPLIPEAHFIGLDVSSRSLELAAKRIPSLETHHVEDGGAFPLEDKSVDFLYSSEVIEHVYDTEAAFSEIARILKPGGRVLMTTPFHGFIKNLLILFYGFDKHFKPTGPHVRFFTRKSLVGVFEKVGLKAIKVTHCGRFYPIPWCLIVLAEKPL